MKFALRLVFLLFLIPCLCPFEAMAQQSTTTERFFRIIDSYCAYGSLSEVGQDQLTDIHERQYSHLVPVGPRASERLFEDSRFFQVRDSGVYYYAYLPTYGNFYQVVLCVQGPYSPSLVLMTYSRRGRLLSELNLAGNFIDGGNYFIWSSQFLNEATISFTYKSYFEREGKFYCDSSITRYSIREDGFVRPMTQLAYTVRTAAIRGAQQEVVEANQTFARVFAPSGLKLRTSLNRRARTQVVPFGAEVEVVRSTPSTYFIDWIQGNWSFVRFDSTEGYMFDGYLSLLPSPNLRARPCQDDFAGLLAAYVAQSLEAVREPDTLFVAEASTDSLHLHLRQFLADSLEFHTYVYDTSVVRELLLPASNVEEAYVLIQSLLSPCTDTDILDDKILFVKNRYGRIHKIYDREGRVEIREGKRNQVYVRMRTIKRTK